ncbi:MAG TPA: DUF2071 domain-containing protein [Anaerolineae bacterium]|nr:DUF2071 domain-containing protein [Anaerolineae bacterium]HMR64849.1 DUF2071 domain-containing protein [Anaerolineae bacterium]
MSVAVGSPSLTARLAVRERPKHRPPVMYQSWRDLLFLHWVVEPDIIQSTLPPGLHVDTFDGRAYLGVVPFFMCNIRPRFCPAVPAISNFLELNLRTYVYNDRGLTGVWFYSLDASQKLAVKVARTFFKLPYYHAQMQAERDLYNQIHYTSRRYGAQIDTLSRFRYAPYGSPRVAEPGSLEFFLVERYVLFAYDLERKKLFSGRVYHLPYLITEASVSVWSDQLWSLADFERPGRLPDHSLFSPGVDVDVFAIEAA